MTVEATVGDGLTENGYGSAGNDDEGKDVIINVGNDSSQFYARLSDGYVSGLPGPVRELFVEISWPVGSNMPVSARASRTRVKPSPASIAYLR